MKKIFKGLVVGVFALALTFSTPLETKASDWYAPCGHGIEYQEMVILSEATCKTEYVTATKCTKCNFLHNVYHSGRYGHSWMRYNSYRKICIKCGHAQSF